MLLACAGCGGDVTLSLTSVANPVPEPKYQATIRRTEYGIPHIEAEDWGSLGYGYGYAYAQDNFCTAMRGIVAATSRSAELLGEAEGDPVTDFVLRFLFGDRDAFKANFMPDADTPAHRLVEGFAVGMNRHLRETGAANLPEGESGCRDADWVFEFDATDLWMLLARIPLKGSSDEGIVRRAIFNAAGPNPSTTGTFEEVSQAELADGLGRLAHALIGLGHGSNALAVGSSLSQSGKGLLLGNPHRSWSGDGSFYQVHLTLPGEYDVAGAALQGLPWIGIGFNRDLAWTHTTSFATRFTLHELQLNPDNLMQYRYDGQWRDITTEEVAIQVKGPDGALEERTHTFYRSHFGPVVNLRELSGLFDPWPLANGSVLALRDANQPRADAFFEQYRRMGQAGDLDQFTEALQSIAIPVFHTLAADRHGEAFYGEVAAVPRITQAQLDGCLTRIGRLLAGLTNNAALVLDGSDPACEWGEDGDSPPGTQLYGYEARPKVRTRDYVGNSNDSYWLSDPNNPLTGYPLVFGWLADDFTNVVDSDRFWAADFDPADPLRTPHGIDLDEPRNRELVITALSEAVLALEEAGISLNAPWGDAQFAVRNNLRIPIHGGDGNLGVYGAVSSSLGDGGYRAHGGNSHLQAVTWGDDECPVADTLLVPSQSSDPQSPHYADQTELYSRKEWVRFPFCEAEISAAQVGEAQVIKE